MQNIGGGGLIANQIPDEGICPERERRESKDLSSYPRMIAVLLAPSEVEGSERRELKGLSSNATKHV
jgi:hypothetical protein